MAATFALGRRGGEDGVDHAVAQSGTLCGIPRGEIVVYRSLFEPSGGDACAPCRDEASRAPTEPGVQERLHGLLVGVGGPLGEELREALRSGAAVTFWVNGGGRMMMRHYVTRPILEGEAGVASLAEFDGSLGVARVRVGARRRFVVLLPVGGEPVVAVEAAT